MGQRHAGLLGDAFRERPLDRPCPSLKSRIERLRDLKKLGRAHLAQLVGGSPRREVRERDGLLMVIFHGLGVSEE